MRLMTRFLRAAMLLPIIALSSCYELQSDEELRQDIIGTWKKVDCKHPYVDDKEVTAESLLMDRLDFNTSGEFNEFGLYAYCCSTDCDTSFQGSCTWMIEGGQLVIIPVIPPGSGSHLNQPYPIKVLKKDLLVFDNVNISGQDMKRTKTCYCRE